jgi:serine protease Do
MLGTGFIFASRLLATNAHVVGNESIVQVESQDGRRFKAKVIKKDVRQDFAILQFDNSTIAPFFALIPIRHAGTPEIGEGVVIIGTPDGLKGTVTAGIVSQINSDGTIQLNAAINPGNSGGPVFDMQGRVFGIASKKIFQTPDGYPVDGLGVAIPIRWLEGQ